MKYKNSPLWQGVFLFGLGKGFEAFGADFLPYAIHFFDLKIDFELSERGDVGMASAVSGLAPSVANIADSTHVFIWN